MIDFDRFWMEGNTPYPDEDDEGEGEGDVDVPPGVGEDAIREWERTHGVRLPEPIRTALGIRNGGYVRNAPIEILPLERIVPAEDEFWEWTELDADEAPDHSKMFVFGDEVETGATFLMNFNARGPGASPSIYLDHHGESTYLVDDTMDGFFDAMLASDETPSVDWSEAESGARPDVPVLAREAINLAALYGGKAATRELVLVRDGETLILFSRDQSPEGEILTRTTLPLPLDAAWAQVRAYRPGPIGTFGLHLQPEESEGIIERRSETNADGRWKNTTGRGTPIYAILESTDRGRLDALRARLFGAEAAAQAQARQDRHAEFAALLQGLPPDQRTAALLQAGLNIKEEVDRQFAANFADLNLGDLPPELAGAADALRRRLEAMTERIRAQSAANPPDPEMLKRIEGYLKDGGSAP